MSSHIKIMLILLMSICLNQSCAFSASKVIAKQKPENFELIILHTNDIHAHDLPFKEKGHLIGGLSKIAYLVSSMRKQHNNVVVVDAGDFFKVLLCSSAMGAKSKLRL